MDFRNAYAQGFARVAACTVPVALADPATNAERVIEQVKDCHDEGVAVALFPELSPVRLRHRRPAAAGRPARRRRRRGRHHRRGHRQAAAPSSSSAPRCGTATGSTTARSSSTAVRCSASRRSRSCPTTASSTRSGTSRPAPDTRASSSCARTGPVPTSTARSPSAPTSSSTPDDLPGLAVHVEICEDMWVPVPAEPRGRARRCDRPAQPLRPPRSPSAAPRTATCSPARRARAATPPTSTPPRRAGESSTDLSWDGMTMVYEMGDLLGESERFPDGPRAHRRRRRPRPAAPGAHAAGQLRRQRRGVRRRPRAGSASSRSQLRPPTRRPRPASRGRPLPVRARRRGPPRARLLRGLQHPGLRARAADAGHRRGRPGADADDRHRRLRRARLHPRAHRRGQGVDRLGRPRTHILGFTMPGFATSAGTKSNAIHLMESLGITWEELDIRPAATQMLTDLGHPFGRGEEVYDVTFENVQAGLRTDYLFRAANQRGGIVLGTGDLSELALGWCTYGVGDQMSHYGVNTGVPKTLMQHLIRWVVSSASSRARSTAPCSRSSTRRSAPSSSPPRRASGSSPPRTRSAPTPCRTSRSSTCCDAATGRARSPSSPSTRGRDAGSGAWPAGYPEGARPAYDLATIRRWMEVFVQRFFANQFKRSAHPQRPQGRRGRLAVAAR